MEFIKTLLCYSVMSLSKIFLIFSINQKKIIFYPLNGKYYDNLKYVSELLLKMENNLKVVFVVDKTFIGEYPVEIKVCEKNSISFFFHALTSKCIVFNSGFKNYMHKRKGQVYIETWHGGGAYKKAGIRVSEIQNKFLRKRVVDAINRIDYIISSCRAFTEAFKYDTSATKSTYCPFGMPRNDIFFDNIWMELAKDNVRKYYKINSKKIVLYAPTFRDNGFNNDLDFEKLLSVLEGKYKSEFVLFLRCHPHLTKDIFEKYRGRSNIVDVSEYTDMQELLCASDILITDYSSCMWDFSLMFRPCFIYANDVADYKEERNFHTSMSEWPFPIATNNEELEKNIMDFDEISYKEEVENHHKALGSYEDGHASERVCRLIEEICLGKE